jgi:ketosteroid isomerase-like protein
MIDRSDFMIGRHAAKYISLIGAACLPLSPANAAVSSRSVAEVQALSQKLLDALGSGDATTWNRYVDDEVTVVDETGAILRKAELLKEIAPLPPGSSAKFTIETYVAREFGDVIVGTHHDVSEQVVFGQTVHPEFRTVETWRRKAGNWKLIASQTMLIDSPPKAQTLPTEWLKEYEGAYSASESAVYNLKVVGGQLQAQRPGKTPKIFQVEARDAFFVSGQPGRLIMLRSPTGQLTGFVDRRPGQEILWTKR